MIYWENYVFLVYDHNSANTININRIRAGNLEAFLKKIEDIFLKNDIEILKG